jgi:outer membrane protein TolC
VNAYSQSILTKEQALQTLLENNYAVKLSKNDVKIAENNASIYNSKYLPTIAVNAGANYSNLNQEIEAQSGTTTSNDNAETQTYNASLGFNYTLFNGFNRKYIYAQLQEQLALSELDAETTLEQAILSVFTSYYQTAQIAENVRVLEAVLKISKQRLQRTKYQYDFGQTNKLAVLNAEVDVNNDSISYINTKLVLDNSKRNLLLLIGETQAKDFDVETQVQFLPIPNLESFLDNLPQNISVQQIEKMLEISAYGIKSSKSGYLPTIGVNGSYAWNQYKYPETSTSAGLISSGINAGLSLSWNVFDGGATKTRVQNAQIIQENQVLAKEQLVHQLKNLITNTYYDYQNKKFVLDTQNQNLVTAETNFQRTEEQFKIGRVTSVEYRQAQLNLLNAQTAILSAKYDAKTVELQLLQLTGSLIKGFNL